MVSLQLMNVKRNGTPPAQPVVVDADGVGYSVSIVCNECETPDHSFRERAKSAQCGRSTTIVRIHKQLEKG
jgi:hypothetical protein